MKSPLQKIKHALVKMEVTYLKNKMKPIQISGVGDADWYEIIRNQNKLVSNKKTSA